jgi:putative flippase GtrA
MPSHGESQSRVVAYVREYWTYQMGNFVGVKIRYGVMVMVPRDIAVFERKHIVVVAVVMYVVWRRLLTNCDCSINNPTVLLYDM